MVKHTLELGQRIFDSGWDDQGVVVVRIVDGDYKILEGYEDNQEVKDWLWAISDEEERLCFMEKNGVTYTYIGDHQVTEING